MKVFNFGSINIDHVYRVPHLVAPGETLASASLTTVLGGKGANQSVALAKAGCAVQHIGKLGEGDAWARTQLSDAGVDVSSVELVDGPSGHAIIQVEDSGENSIILHGGANQSFTQEEIHHSLSSAGTDDWLLLQNECNNIEGAFEHARHLGLSIAFNPAPMSSQVTQLPLDQCAILIVNETEATELAQTQDLDSAIQILGKRFPDTRVVLTRGAQGVLLMHRSELTSADALEVEAVDTTGAGDTFVGYYLASKMEGLDDQLALQRSCAAAALSVTKQGATPSIPLSNEVDTLLQNL